MTNNHRKQQITLPGLSFKERQIAYVRVESKMHLSERTEKDKDGKKPATVVKVTNLQDGLMYRLICPALLVSSFQDEGEDYVGKCYEIIVTENVMPGKQYKGVQAFEIDGSVDYSDFPTKVIKDEAKK